MHPYRLAAFDPGERTGYVVVRVSGQFKATDPATHTPEHFAIEEQGVLPISGIFTDLKRIVKDVNRVSYETWRLYATHAQEMVGNDMQPSQVVGMIRYEARKQRRKLKSYGAETKKVSTQLMPDWLREHMAKSSEQHDQDAIMHAWYYAFKNSWDRGTKHDE
jgi:hypothetical protein